jgi:hypothetical protein
MQTLENTAIVVKIVTASRGEERGAPQLLISLNGIIFALNATSEAFLAGWQLQAEWDPVAMLN